MRRFYALFGALLLLSASSIAQTVIYSQDFSSGIPGSWTNTGTSGGVPNAAVKWKSRTNPTAASGGAFGPSYGTITSPTRANGYISFDSDSLDNGGVAANIGLGPAPAEQDVVLALPVINVAGHPKLKLEFYQFLANYQSVTSVAISTDNVNWTVDTLNADLAVNTATDPADEKVSLNISSIVNGQPNLYVRFLISANYYVWALDDIRVIELPNNDLEVEDFSGQSLTSQGLGLFFSNYPASQIDSVTAVVVYGNIGKAAQPHTVADIGLLKNGSVIATHTTTPSATLAPDSLALDFATLATAGIGSYTASVHVRSDSTDFDPANNSDSLRFVVNDSIFSINNNTAFTNAYYLKRTRYGLDFSIGALFEVKHPDTVTSVSTAVLGGTLYTRAGAKIQATVYPVTVGTTSLSYGAPTISTELKTLVSTDLSTTSTTKLVNMKIDNNTGNPILALGIYWVAIKGVVNTDSNVLVIATSYQKNGFPLIENASTLGTLDYLSSTDAALLLLNFGRGTTCPTATTTTSPSTCGAANGLAVAHLSGSPTGYTYLWTGGATTDSAKNLTPGTYTVTATGNGCVVTATAVVNTSGSISATASATQSACGGTTGTATASPSGGSSYTYSWSTSPAQTGITATGLGAGVYTVTVSSGTCQATATATVTNPGAPQGSTSATPATCAGALTGTATVTSTTGGATFTWNTSPTQSTGTITGLAAGTYTVTVASGACQTVLTQVVTEPQPVAIHLDSVIDVKCYGAATGSITLHVTGGTGSYTYDWSPAGPASAHATGLIGGTYNVTVSDSNLCTASASYNVATPATPFAVFVTATVNEHCWGDTTGAIRTTTSATTGSVTYAWNTTPPQSTANIANLPAGIYTLTVTDFNGCTATVKDTVTQPATPVSVSVSSAPATAIAVGSGGTPGYTYRWDSAPVQNNDTASGLPSGTYTVTVTDANGCNTTASVAVTGVGVNNVAGDISLLDVYPNPTQGAATLEVRLAEPSAMDITITDLRGRKVQELSYKATKSLTAALDLSHLAKGAYILNVKTANGMANKRIILE